jgi:hypothetical protein
MNGVGGQDGVKKCAAFLREKETNKRRLSYRDITNNELLFSVVQYFSYSTRETILRGEGVSAPTWVTPFFVG